MDALEALDFRNLQPDGSTLTPNLLQKMVGTKGQLRKLVLMSHISWEHLEVYRMIPELEALTVCLDDNLGPYHGSAASPRIRLPSLTYLTAVGHTDPCTYLIDGLELGDRMNLTISLRTRPSAQSLSRFFVAIKNTMTNSSLAILDVKVGHLYTWENFSSAESHQVPSSALHPVLHLGCLEVLIAEAVIPIDISDQEFSQILSSLPKLKKLYINRVSPHGFTPFTPLLSPACLLSLATHASNIEDLSIWVNEKWNLLLESHRPLSQYPQLQNFGVGQSRLRLDDSRYTIKGVWEVLTELFPRMASVFQYNTDSRSSKIWEAFDNKLAVVRMKQSITEEDIWLA